MVDDVLRKLLGVELAVGLCKLSRSQIPSRGGSHACPELVLSEVEGRSQRPAGLRAWEPALLQNRDLPPYHTANSPCASRRVKCPMPASSRFITSSTGLRTSSSPAPSARMT